MMCAGLDAFSSVHIHSFTQEGKDMSKTIIYTRNTTYEIKDGDRPGTAIVNGGQFKDVEIFTPMNDKMNIGEPFHFITTDNLNNGRLRNQIMNTSSIQAMGGHPEKVTYELNTRNSQYKLTTVPGKPDIMTISGGALTGLEIKTPSILPEIGERFRFEFTDNPINGSNRGRVMNTSSLQSINRTATMEAPSPIASKSLSMDSARPDAPQRRIVDTPMQQPNIVEQIPVETTEPPVIESTPQQESVQMSQTDRRIKNPFKLAIAFAKNKLTQHFYTKNSMYTLSPVAGNPNAMMLTGGKTIAPMEVQRPQTIPQNGDRLVLTYTNNPINGVYAGKQFASSNIVSKSYSDEHGNGYLEQEVIGGYNKEPEKRISSMDVKTGSSTYTLSAIPGRDDVMILSGGKTPFPLEVHKPQNIPQVGERLSLAYTNNPANGQFAGRYFNSSTVRDISMETSYMQNETVSFGEPDMPGAGKFEVNHHWQTTDFGSKLQTKMTDIAYRASELLGLPDGQEQEIYFTPSVGTREDNHSFQVAFNGFPQGVQSLNAIQQAIHEELAMQGCPQPEFGVQMPVGVKEFEMMRDALSEQALDLDKQSMIENAIVNMERNNDRNSVRSELSTPFIPDTGKSNDGMQF